MSFLVWVKVFIDIKVVIGYRIVEEFEICNLELGVLCYFVFVISMGFLNVFVVSG